MMRSRFNGSLAFLTIAVGVVALAGSEQGPPPPAYDLSWYTIDGGGATFSAGGSFELGGTIGQHDAGGPMAGGAFSLTGGFWSGTPVETCPADITGDDLVNVNDLLAVINAWGAVGGPSDLTGDNLVNVNDLLAVINAWGACP